VPPERILVVSDEVNLPVGKLRHAPQRFSRGHNGTQSIIAALGTDGFPRLRLGVARPAPGLRFGRLVLSGFQGRDAEEMAAAVARAPRPSSVIKRGRGRGDERYNG
jgi:PTH1 family peptidyl-tRNA hydrolase